MLVKRRHIFLHEAYHDKIAAHLYQGSRSSSVFTPSLFSVSLFSIQRRPPLLKYIPLASESETGFQLRFSRSRPELRPWKPSPNDPKGAMAISQR